MLARFFTLFWVVPFALIAKSYLFSPIPAVSNEVLEVDTSMCDLECQKKLLEKEKPFSFISKYDRTSDDNYLRNSYQELKSLLNLDEEVDESKIRVAVLIPSNVIGRYASIVTDSVNAYLLSKSSNFTLKVYDSKKEDMKSLGKKIDEIVGDGFRYVIAPLTAIGAENLARLKLPLQVFIPTISKDDVHVYSQNIVYGGVDYKEQLIKLEVAKSGEKTVVFDEPIPLSQKLTAYIYETYEEEPVVETLKSRRIKFKDLFTKLELDLNTTLVLNTRPVMTSLVLSQLTYHDFNVSNVVSTELNYTPVIVRLTQPRDRKNLTLASSIGDVNNQIIEANEIFNNDINYNWIVYSTTIMTDIIYNRNQKNFISKSEEFNVAIVDNRLEYQTKLYDIFRDRFNPIPELYMDLNQTENN